MINIDFNLSPEVEEEIAVVTETEQSSSIILYNDDYNTFDWVIRSLMTVCNHDLLQAEQCSMIVHYKGKCSVKEGSPDRLKPLKEALVERGLNATIE